MSLRIAWSNYPRNVGLAIAANIFVYIGTIILYGVNWFFVQRVVRAQHARLGWSTPYRIFHRGGLVVLVTTLLIPRFVRHRADVFHHILRRTSYSRRRLPPYPTNRN